MPPSALPACYKPQVISVSASGAVVTSDLSSSSGSTSETSTSGLETQDGHLPELLGPPGPEGAVGEEKAEEGERARLKLAETPQISECNFKHSASCLVTAARTYLSHTGEFMILRS